MSGEIPSPDPIAHGRLFARGFEETCDVVVVGSGAGGSVVAATLAEAGKRVVVIEEGPYYKPDEYQSFTPSQSLRRLFRESGMLTAFGVGETPLISITLGRAVGGSSLLTGAVCFRIPSEVHATWAEEHGLDALSERALEPCYDEVERHMHVREVPEAMRSESTRRFVEGAKKLGIGMRPIRRNTGDACEGNARCNFTCPAGAKRSVDVSYLPRAIANGARVVSDALSERVIVEHGRAVGVEGRLLGGEHGAPSHRFRVRAPVVVIACGTLHTPLLLAATGLRDPSGSLGRNVTLHPAARIVAKHEDRINGWDGALQSAYSDDFASDGIKLVGAYSAVNVLASGLPGVGPELRRRVRETPYHAVFGGMVHDEGGGVVRAGGSREPIVTYAMAPRDLVRLKKAMSLLCQMAIASGAVEVYPPIFGLAPIKTMDQARALEHLRIDARRIECMAFHPLGSARAANDPRRGVVDPWGQSYELPGLFVADGSILPTSIGVNSQVPIMTVATHVARALCDRFPKLRAASERAGKVGIQLG